MKSLKLSSMLSLLLVSIVGSAFFAIASYNESKKIIVLQTETQVQNTISDFVQKIEVENQNVFELFNKVSGIPNFNDPEYDILLKADILDGMANVSSEQVNTFKS